MNPRVDIHDWLCRDKQPKYSLEERIHNFTKATHFRVLRKKCQNHYLRYASWNSDSIHNHVLLVIPGLAAFIEQYMEFIYDLVNIGFNVYTFDFTGHGHSTKLVDHPQKIHVDSYSTYIDDVHALVRKIRSVTKKPIILVGCSMGGHVALRYAAEHPISTQGLFVTSPYTNIFKSRIIHFLWWLFYFILVKLGFAKKYSSKSKPFDKKRFSLNNPLTKEKRHFDHIVKCATLFPDRVTWGVTYGWKKATLESMSLINKKSYLNKIVVPVFFINSGSDKYMPNDKDEAICKNMKRCKFMTYANAGHVLIYESDKLRDRMIIDLCKFTKSLI